MDMIYQFNKFKPPEFQGGTDPLRHEEWMQRFKNLFEIMDFPARFKEGLATYQFEGEAGYWWETAKLRGDEPPITWERLKELMDTKYYPRNATKEQQFLSLKQGNMSVMEYAAKFNELSCFAPHQVATEEMKMDPFEQGLKGSTSR